MKMLSFTDLDTFLRALEKTPKICVPLDGPVCSHSDVFNHPDTLVIVAKASTVCSPTIFMCLEEMFGGHAARSHEEWLR